MKLKLLDNQLSSDSYWTKPISQHILDSFTADDLALFDQNGYDLTPVEQEYAKANGYLPKEHRYLYTCKSKWFTDLEPQTNGPHLNHSDIYFRHGFDGEALQQLENKAKTDPIFHKFTQMRSKWGVDMSIDYADFDGNVFELLHFEWDSFTPQLVKVVKNTVENLVLKTDFDLKAQEMIERKDEWHHLGFFEQSDWKQKFWGLPPENFKEVIWK